MAVVERTGATRQSWREICETYPHRWVCLLEIEWGPERWISSARVVSHGRSIDEAIEDDDPAHHDATLTRTDNMPWRTPRIEIVDEDADMPTVVIARASDDPI